MKSFQPWNRSGPHEKSTTRPATATRTAPGNGRGSESADGKIRRVWIRPFRGLELS
jgi:hypothetical protein